MLLRRESGFGSLVDMTTSSMTMTCAGEMNTTTPVYGYTFLGFGITSFQGTVIVLNCRRNGARPNCSTTTPPPLTMKSNHPDALDSVNPSSDTAELTRTPISGVPLSVTILPRTTAARLREKKGESVIVVAMNAIQTRKDDQQ